MTTIRLRHAALAAAATAAALGWTATARAGRYEIGIGATTHHMASPSMDPLTADDGHTLFSADAAVRLGAAPLGTDLSAGIEYQGGTISGTMFQTIATSTSVESAVAFARVSKYLRWKLRGFVRAGIGFSHVSLRLSDVTSDAEPLTDGGAGLTTMAAGGLEYTPIRLQNDVKVALRAELGYSRTAAVALRAVPASRTGDGNALRIPSAYASLGDVDVSGWIFHVGLVTRF